MNDIQLINIGVFALTAFAIGAMALLVSLWKKFSKGILQQLEKEQRLNVLNTKALNYIANKYPGLVNEAFQNIDREGIENV